MRKPSATLATVTPGRPAVVEAVAGEAEDVVRLQAMGICQGRRLLVVRAGDPLVVRVLASRVGLSARLADRVLVRPCPLA